MKAHTRHLTSAIVILFVLGLGASVFAWSGLYNIGADEPHMRATHALLETLRERSIESRASKLTVPDLSDLAKAIQGAGNYNAMCVGCHLAPGMEESELSKGLYPAPPNLSREPVAVAHAFWVIKHGIKASGMPAWGKSMSDEYIWNMAAFLQVLPTLDDAKYDDMVARSGGHSHGGGESGHHHHHEEAMGVGETEHAHDDGEEAHSHDSGEADELHDEATQSGSTVKAHTHEKALAESVSSIDVPADAVAASATVDRFSKALQSGDMKAVETLLDPEVLIFESGGAERSRQEYLGHHAAADAKFLKDAQIQLISRTGKRGGDLVWIGSESEIHTKGGDKPQTLLSTETMVLKKVGDDWRIVHIHWSSQLKS